MQYRKHIRIRNLYIKIFFPAHSGIPGAGIMGVFTYVRGKIPAQ